MAALNQPYAASPGQSRQTRSVSPNTSDTDEDLRQTDNTPTPGAAPSSKKRLAAISEVEGSPVTDYSAASDDEDATPHNELHMHNLSLEEQQRRQEYQADFAERQQIGGGMLRQVTIKSGYLHKKGEKRKTWKKRYFVLRPDWLCYYKDDKEYQILRHIAIPEVHACAQVEVKRYDNSFGIVTPKRTYYVRASSPTEAEDWVNSINAARAAIEQAKASAAKAQAHTSPPRPQPQTQAAQPIPLSGVQEGTSSGPDTYLSSSFASTGTSGEASEVPLSLALSSSEEEDEPGAPTHAMNVPPTPSPQAIVGSSAPGTGGTQAHRALSNMEPNRAIVAGYLVKQGKRKSWRKRWFVLTSQRLMYARSHVDSRVNRSIPLDQILDVMEVSAPARGRSASSAGNPGGQGGSSTTSPSMGNGDAGQAQRMTNCFKIITPSRTFIVSAPTEEDEIQWLSAIRVLLNARRKPSVQNPPPQQLSVSPAAVAAAAVVSASPAPPPQPPQPIAQGDEERYTARGNYPSIHSKFEAPLQSQHIPF